MEVRAFGVFDVEGGGVAFLVAGQSEEVAASVVEVEVVVADLEVEGSVEVDSVEQRIQEARGQLQTALLRLRTSIGDEDLEGFSVDSSLPSAFGAFRP